MRTIAEIRGTGAAWVSESELEWLCNVAEAAERIDSEYSEPRRGQTGGATTGVRRPLLRYLREALERFPAESNQDRTPDVPGPASRPDVSERETNRERRGQSTADLSAGLSKRLLWPARKFLRSADNYRRGFAFGYVRRCRVCGHTAYRPEHPRH